MSAEPPPPPIPTLLHSNSPSPPHHPSPTPTVHKGHLCTQKLEVWRRRWRRKKIHRKPMVPPLGTNFLVHSICFHYNKSKKYPKISHTRRFRALHALPSSSSGGVRGGLRPPDLSRGVWRQDGFAPPPLTYVLYKPLEKKICQKIRKLNFSKKVPICNNF